MGMTQPNASRAIAGLEAQNGLSLVQRTPTGSQLTLEGTLVAKWARSVLRTAQRLREGIGALKNENSSKLSIAASMTVAEYLVPQWLSSFKRTHPDVKVSFTVRNSRAVLEGVRRGDSDVGFVESPEPAAKLRETVIGHDRLTVVVHPAHPWAARDNALSIEELSQTPLIVREEGSGTRVTLDNFLAPYKPASPSIELHSNAAVRVGAQAGMGPAVLSYLVAEEALRAGELMAIPVSGLNIIRSFRAVWDDSQRLTGAKAAFANIVTTHDQTTARLQNH